MVLVTIDHIKFDIVGIAQAIDNLTPTAADAAAEFYVFPADVVKKCIDALSILLFIFGANVLTNKKSLVDLNML